MSHSILITFSDNASLESHSFSNLNLLTNNSQGIILAPYHDVFPAPPNMVTELNDVMYGMCMGPAFPN